jgi:copper chaperone CopZ
MAVIIELYQIVFPAKHAPSPGLAMLLLIALLSPSCKELQMTARLLIATTLLMTVPFGIHAQNEVKLEVNGVHLCCFACVNSVNGIIKKVDGASVVCDQKAKKVTITAPDKATLQKALEALAAGGFHGETGDKDLAIKEDSGVTAGKVQSLKVVGVHNCCATCTRDIKSVLKKVDGVTEDTVASRKSSFEVKGNFDAKQVIKALNDAGYHAKVEKK